MIAVPDLKLRVASITTVAERVVALELEPTDGSALPTWEPGAHVDVTLGDGMIRQYSICSPPGTDRWRFGVLEEIEGKGSSHYVHHDLREGDVIAVSGPRNTFALDLGGRPVVFIAGGIGVTPILPMVHAAAAEGADWTLLYLARSPEAAAFVDEVMPYGDRVHVHHDSVAGIIDLAASLDALGAAGSDVYACGPTGLLNAIEAYAGDRPDCHLTVERFAGTGDEGPREGDTEFVVEINDGTKITVGAQETILDALVRSGIPMLSSCQEGVCGTCETAVIEGIPDHRDHVLNDEERAGNEMMMPCVSRCLGKRLVLDL